MIGFFPRLSSFSVSVRTESIIAFVFSGSIVRYAPCSVCLTEDMISCSTFGSSVMTLVVSFDGKYLLEIARFQALPYIFRQHIRISGCLCMICQRFKNRQKIPDRNAFPQKILQYFLNLSKAKKFRREFVHKNRIGFF